MWYNRLYNKNYHFTSGVNALPPIGIYIHIPFCKSKCAYCDFYSFKADDTLMQRYTDKICDDIKTYAKLTAANADTLYFGGGTPSLLGGERIAQIVECAAESFSLDKNSEITLEANPADDLYDTLLFAKRAGVNRLSLGVQSGIDGELRILGRRHGTSSVMRSVDAARRAGIDNISLDLMLGIPDQTAESLRKSVDFLTALSPAHISAYLLKIEKNTPFGRKPPATLPDDDMSAQLYLCAVELLEGRGYEQYEISNFAKGGWISRHNTKYWTGGEYLGLGPAAHSMMDGKRFYFDADIDRYLAGRTPIADGMGGGSEEYVMLRLRLCDGIDFADYRESFGEISKYAKKRMEQFAKTGLAVLDDEHFALTPRGFLLSNTIISDLLELM